jgi:hypothetical protein
MGGLYLFGAHMKFNSIAGGAHNLYGIRFTLTGNVVALDQQMQYENSSIVLSLYTMAHCDEADYMKVHVFQASGDTLAIDYQSGYSPIFWCTQLGK